MGAVTYRIKDPTVGLIQVETHETTVTIPAGSVVKADQLPSEPAQVICVEWQGRRVKMFARDLRTRAEQIPSQAA